MSIMPYVIHVHTHVSVYPYFIPIPNHNPPTLRATPQKHCMMLSGALHWQPLWAAAASAVILFIGIAVWLSRAGSRAQWVNRGIWSLCDPYDPSRWPLLPCPKLGRRDLLSLRYRSKRVFLKRTLIWPEMAKYQMYLTFWTPLGHIDLNLKN